MSITETPNTKKYLKDTKFFELCLSTSLMNDLVPDIRVQMVAEDEIQHMAPRSEDISDATRILINYTNETGNSALFQILDNERLDNKEDVINIDKFISEYHVGETEIEDPLVKLKLTVVSALTYSFVVCLGISDERETKGAKLLAEHFVKAAVSAIYDDPLDILVIMRDVKLENDAVVTVIDKMWVIKPRPKHAV